jgi:hypothetical protein
MISYSSSWHLLLKVECLIDDKNKQRTPPWACAKLPPATPLQHYESS